MEAPNLGALRLVPGLSLTLFRVWLPRRRSTAADLQLSRCHSHSKCSPRRATAIAQRCGRGTAARGHVHGRRRGGWKLDSSRHVKGGAVWHGPVASDSTWNTAERNSALVVESGQRTGTSSIPTTDMPGRKAAPVLKVTAKGTRMAGCRAVKCAEHCIRSKTFSERAA